MKKSIILVALLALGLAASAQRTTGLNLRVGGGYPAHANLGIGYNITPRLSVELQAFTTTQFFGIAGGIDARYYFLEKPITPFVNLRAGYGMLGKTLENKNFYDLTFSGMVGVSWKRFDLGVGMGYDLYNPFIPFVNLSYSIPLGRN